MNPLHSPTPETDLRWPIAVSAAPPEPGTVHVWCSVLRCGPEVLSGLDRLLSPDETHRASRFRNTELRRRFVVSRGVLRRVLAGCLNTNPGELTFTSDANGKPHLAKERALQFNLAHTADLMLLAVTRGAPLGVDVERIRRLSDPRGIARRFFSAREADWLCQVNAAELDRAFFRLWTRKEAILKATGEGISSGLNSIELLDAHHHLQETVRRHPSNPEATSWVLTELEPASGFVASLALPATAGRPVLHTATFQPA